MRLTHHARRHADNGGETEVSHDKFLHHDTVSAVGADDRRESGWFDILEDETSPYVYDRGSGMVLSRHKSVETATAAAQRAAKAWDEVAALRAPQGESPSRWTQGANWLADYSADVGWRVLDLESDNLDLIADVDPDNIATELGLDPSAYALLLAAARELARALLAIVEAMPDAVRQVNAQPGCPAFPSSLAVLAERAAHVLRKAGAL